MGLKYQQWQSRESQFQQNQMKTQALFLFNLKVESELIKMIES